MTRGTFYFNCAMAGANIGCCIVRPNWFNGLIGFGCAACAVEFYARSRRRGGAVNFCRDCANNRAGTCLEDPRGGPFDLVTGEPGQKYYDCRTTRSHEPWARKPECQRFRPLVAPTEDQSPRPWWRTLLEWLR